MSLISFLYQITGSSIIVRDLALTTEELLLQFLFLCTTKNIMQKILLMDGSHHNKWALKTIIIKSLLCVGAVGP